MRTTSLENKLRAVVLSFRPCKDGFREFIGYLKTYQGEVYALLRNGRDELASDSSSNLRFHFGWLLEKLRLPGGVISVQKLYDAGVRVRGALDWWLILAYAQTIDQIIAAIERAYKALSPTDRRRRTWAQRRKS